MVEAFTYLPGPDHGPSEIAAATGLSPTVVYRIVQSGIPVGLFVRGPAGRYWLGPGAAQVGMRAMAAAALEPGAARPILDRLSRALNGLSLLWVLSAHGPGRVVAEAAGRYGFDALGLSIGDFIRLGSTLRTGASGRAIAAHLPSHMVDAIAAEPLPPSAGPGVLRAPRDFRSALEDVRQAGYAVGREEMPGWPEVAAPVMWGDVVYGAVAVLVPAPLMPRDLAAPVALTTSAAGKITRLMSRGHGTASLLPHG
ncbi:IclR-family regulator [Streptomyces viridochromogenes DSM 40736]|uniref:IclR-family regulator n=1 Tax=Streptomyces viridochromogenes (strain DSM 40736 / JCM 4977 / BCRC 1201 / Tue 494) TaxID=591159 RepID=D9X1S6_STRVT|nr:IclR-family regulator [Streptomyces viridochromogenes DSM 40736]